MYIADIVQNGLPISDNERYERVLRIIEEYGLEIIFSIALKQHFDWIPQAKHERNVAFANSLSRSNQIILTEIIEAVFIDTDKPIIETRH